MTDDRIAALEQRLAQALSAGGASVTIQDPRVSGMLKIGAGIFATITVSVMIWVANSINRLNETMARVATQNESIMATLQDHSERLKELERRYATR